MPNTDAPPQTPSLYGAAGAADRIAALLGSSREWDGPADYLETIARILQQAGYRPVGDQSDLDLEHYRTSAEAYGLI